MYILEYLIKKILPKPKRPQISFEQEYTKCEHIFMPIDSSKKRFACTKCGTFATFEPKKHQPNPFLQKKENIFEEKPMIFY